MSRPSVHNLRHMRLANRCRILRLIRRGPVARSELSAETGLTRAAMSLIMADLIEEGVVIERGLRPRALGRKPVLVELSPDYACTLGLNISRTGASVGLVDFSGKLLVEEAIDISSRQRSVCLRQIRLGIKKVLGRIRASRTRLLGLGISAPGPIDSRNGVVLNPPNFDLWHGARVVEEFQDICEGRVFLENNAIALTISEIAYGKGRECTNFLLLAVTSGVGGGLVQHGELYRGWGGFGNEIGHTSVDQHGPVCGCGLRGCMELYASVPNLVRRAVEHKPAITSWNKLADAAHEGDRLCTRLVEEQAHAISIALVNMLNVLEFEAVVLTGDILYRGDMLRSRIEQKINEYAINRGLHHIPVFLSPLTERSETMAAASIAMQAFFQGETDDAVDAVVARFDNRSMSYR